MKYRKHQFAKRFNLLEKEVNKLPTLRRNRIKPKQEQINRIYRAKKLLNIMNERFPIIVQKMEQKVSLKVITDNLKYPLD